MEGVRSWYSAGEAEMKTILLAVAWGIVAGCQSPPLQPRYCGDTFCLNSISADRVTKTTPVDDFNIYKIHYNGREYFIYEGDNPQPPGRYLRSIRSSYPTNTVQMFRGDDMVEVRFDQGPRTRPFAIGEAAGAQFLVAWTPCANDQECKIEEFARLIVARP